MRVLLITTGQPSVNPRLVKEADLLSDAGYEVTVLYSYWNNWATEYDKSLLANKKWRAFCIGGDPTEKRVAYFLSRLIHKLTSLFKLFPTEWRISRTSYFLINEAKKYIADIYIAHNLGALPAVVKAAKLHSKPCGFDAEDFHRNETTNDSHEAGVILKSTIENKYIPLVDYLTVSSPQIGDAYLSLYPIKNMVTILNAFNTPANIAKPPLGKQTGLSLFWFSQTVGPGRGLEEVALALQLINDPTIQLHLLGEQSPSFNRVLTGLYGNIKFYSPISPDDIIAFAARFDVGIATERNTPYNRDICLTNKLFTYLQAGLAIIASDTIAQSWFIDQQPEVGSIYPLGNSERLAEVIRSYLDTQFLSYRKIVSRKIADSKLNWDIEAEKLLKLINSILQVE